MKIKDGLSPIISTQGNNNYVPSSTAQVGRVYGVVLGENQPTQKQYERVGGIGAIGTIFYLDYDASNNVTGDNSDEFFDTCKVAQQLQPQSQYYPLLNELVYLEDLPAAPSQITGTASQKYYLSVINIWNNVQHNASPSDENDSLGSTFVESDIVQALQPEEGDFILQGRKGLSLRFGSKKGSPITIISNGHAKSKKSLYTEQINDDASSLWLTTNQLTDLIIPNVINPLTQPTAVTKYSGSQAIMNANRIVINSNKDDLMLSSTKNVEITTKNIINLNSEDRVHLNSPYIFLGTKDGTKLPTEPVLLGNKTVELLADVFLNIHAFCAGLASTVTGSPGAPAVDINVAAVSLMESIEKSMNDLKSISSKKVFLD